MLRSHSIQRLVQAYVWRSLGGYFGRGVFMCCGNDTYSDAHTLHRAHPCCAGASQLSQQTNWHALTCHQQPEEAGGVQQQQNHSLLIKQQYNLRPHHHHHHNHGSQQHRYETLQSAQPPRNAPALKIYKGNWIMPVRFLVGELACQLVTRVNRIVNS